MQVSNTFHKLNLAHPYTSVSPTNKAIIGMEGGSRSGKTRQICKYLTLVSQMYANKGITTRIFREDNKNCMATVFEDFIATLDELGQYNRKNYHATKQTYVHFGNRFKFHGLDDRKAHGLPSDIAYFNEALDFNDDRAFKQINMRCNMLTILDWNPRCTDHWVFDLEKRPDAKFITSTWRDNAFIPPGQLKEILAYEPTPDNIRAGTADEFMYKVYNLGIRSSMTGMIYNNVTWIEQFPDDCEEITFGLDFGHTNSATALTKIGKKGNNIYIQGLFYEPCDDVNVISQVLTMSIGDAHVWADSAEELIIAKLRSLGHVVLPAYKPAGSIVDGITICKSYKMHCVKDVNLKKEIDNYKWREVGGIVLNEPVKGNDHYCDSFRYGVVMQWR